MPAAYHSGDIITSGVAAPQVGSNMQGLIDSNPYRNAEYRVSPWNQFLSWLGFRTPADAWRENMAVQASEYDNAILQKQYDQEYNNPTNQLARMRAAGLNPDINGGESISSGSAEPMPEDPSTPMQSTGDDVQLMNFASGILSSISTAVGIVGSLQGIVRNRAENSLSQARVEEAVRSLSKGVFVDSLPDSPTVEGEWSVEDSRSFALDRAESILGKLPKKLRKRALEYVQGYWDSAPATKEAFDNWMSMAKNQKGFYSETGMFYSVVPELMREIYKELGSLNEEIYKARQSADFEGASADFAENKNRGDFAAAISDNGGIPLAAANFAEGQKDAYRTHSISASINSSMLRITKKLEAHSREGGITGVFASALLVAMSMQQMQMLPSMNFMGKTSPKGNSSAFSIGF